MHNDKLTEVYLRDHLAVVVGGIELARRFLAQSANAGFADDVRALLRSFEDDREALEALMAALDVPPSRLKNAASWLAEKLGRLKLNGRLTGYSPLSRVVELEGLLAITAVRRGLWGALHSVADAHPALGQTGAARRLHRAGEQYERLAALHGRAARMALAA